jgi:class 3 adenylate cyclase
MERFARWLWRRWRHRWQFALILTVVSMQTVLINLPSVALLALFLDASLGQTLATLGVMTIGIGAFSVACLVVFGRPHFRALRRWATHTDDPHEAWDALHSLAVDVSLRGMVAAIPVGLGLVAVEAFVVFDGSWPEYWAMVAAAAAAGLNTVMVIGISLDLLLRPVCEDVDATGVISSVRAGPSVRVRLSAAILVAAVANGAYVAAVAVRFTSPAAQLAATAVVAVAAAVFVAAVLAWPTVLAPVIRPLDDLLEGTRRVANGVYTERVPRTSADEFGEVIQSFNDMQAGLLERERLHTAFGSYVDPSLARRLLDQSDELFAGEDVEVTVFFADVRDFTSYAERATPREAVERLNLLFRIVVPVLRSHCGHANKFLGDGVLAVFGVPEPVERHADQAVAAACEIQRQVRARFGDEMRVGIGINTGRAIAGTIGGGGKLEFTLIGDTVNVAARVERATKETGDAILLTQETFDAITPSSVVLEPRGHHALEGKAAPTPLYAVRPGRY